MLVVSAYLLELIYGLLISDAGIRKRHENGNGQFYLTTKHRSFAEKICNVFKMHGIDGNVRQHNPGKQMLKLGYTNQWRYESVHTTFFTTLYRKWYVDGTKIVPKIKTITSTMLAFWIIGDGHNQPMQNNQSRRIILCTDSFTRNDQQYLIKKFSKINIHSHLEKVRIGKSGVQQYRIVISIARDVNNIIEKITPIIIPAYLEFSYKLEHSIVTRTRFTRHMTNDLKIIAQTDPQKAKSIKNKKANKHRRNRHANDGKYAQKNRDRANSYYANLTPEQKEQKKQRRQELAWQRKNNP